jgi:hypothetical protein
VTVSGIPEVILAARCPEHGLHGERTTCFECGGPVEQVPMVRLADVGDSLFEMVELRREIRRQDEKHGPFEGTRLGRSRLAVACLEDEVRETAEAWREERGVPGWPKTRAEVIQVAAVAIRAVRDAL